MEPEEYMKLPHEELTARINRARKEKNAVILAHNYQILEVQHIADYLGDSLELSRIAAGTDTDVVVFCGVDFMAESAKILSPDKTVLIPEKNKALIQRGLSSYRVELLRRESFESQEAEPLLKEQLGVRSLSGFGCDGMGEGVVAAGALIHYLKETQKGTLSHIKEISSYRLGQFMFLDEATMTNLELFRTMRRHSEKGSLFHILDRTVTPMGGRRLRRWMGYPLLDLESIRQRLAAVADFRDDPMFREEIRQALEGIYDMERLNGRIALGRANPRDLVGLKSSILRTPAIKKRLSEATSVRLSEIAATLDTLQDVAQMIHEAIVEDPPVFLREGGYIREGYDQALDELIAISRDGKAWISQLTATEQKRTGISTLKVGFNKVFGYGRAVQG